MSKQSNTSYLAAFKYGFIAAFVIILLFLAKFIIFAILFIMVIVIAAMTGFFSVDDTGFCPGREKTKEEKEREAHYKKYGRSFLDKWD